MAITRINAMDYLAKKFIAFATEVAQEANSDDDEDGYGPDIDDALRDMDVAEASLATATVAEADRRAFYTLCEYYAARRFWVLMSARADTRLGPRSKSWGKSIDSIKAIMDDASSRAAALGYSVDAENTWTFSRLGLDSIEPEVTA